MSDALIKLIYLGAAALFIIGLRRQQSPATARQGNALAAGGMFVAVVVTLLADQILSPLWMLGGLLAGSLIGAVLAHRVEMTGMPELVAAFNGFGGLASALVAGSKIADLAHTGTELDALTAVTIALTILIGVVTFSGSFVAFGKLSGRLSGNPSSFTGMRLLTVLALAGVLAAGGYLAVQAGHFPEQAAPVAYAALVLGTLALVLGILLVIPIGGADMPVVVALLNSYSGLAAAAAGFVLNNVVLIVSGTLVGAAGFILTMIMCEAMNRSLANVLLGGFGGETSVGPAVEGAEEGRPVNETEAQDTALLCSYADQVIIVPGYGMAVAQAQHQVRELADLLGEKGIDVKFAIHPVAGRMPGHMNVLLAEANVPYDQLYEMDDVNGEFAQAGVALVIGANDVVNPAARQDESSPIYGMPILNVDESENVIVFKRSLRPGYSGIPNELFYNENTKMFFGDAKESTGDLVAAVKDL